MRPVCDQPLILKDGTEVGCRRCKQCKANYVTDWVGRCIAEGEVSAAVSSVTLTYRDRGMRSDLLTYSDFKSFVRRLRRGGYPVRFVAAGEYGSKKGRAHWHAILFWRGRVPLHPIRRNFEQTHWPHGFSFWDESNVSALRYVCKYIMKADGDGNAQALFRMSKYPPLGSEYFRRLARQYVNAGLAPQDASYQFQGVNMPNGEPVRFWLHRASLDLFLSSYLVQWDLYRGGHPPVSPFLEEWCDAHVSLLPMREGGKVLPSSVNR